jgi:hypothetical protein
MIERDAPPGWSLSVEDDGNRVVVCGGCGRAMSWRQFLEHGPDCAGREEAA